jgi:GTP-binding protein
MKAPNPLIDQPVEFVGSFPDPHQVLAPPLPEVIFLGRSNVGKSSLINAVVGRRIAKTSATPGKTQHLNAFRFPGFYLLDLPGYGYAKASRAERQRLRHLVDRTIRERRTVAGVVWLLDIRHPPSKDDLAMADVLASSGRGAIVVLTKADKLARARRLAAHRARAAELGLAPDDLLVTSSAKGTGIDELGAAIDAATASGREHGAARL